MSAREAAAAPLDYEPVAEIKHGQVGIANIKLKKLDAEALEAELRAKVAGAEKLFRHAPVVLDLSHLPQLPDTAVVRDLLERIHAAGMLPGYELSPPSGETGVYTAAIYPADLDYERTIHIDQYSGERLVDIAYGDYPATGKAIEWSINLHKGQQWGLFNQLLMLATCFLVIAMSVSGVVMWWKRRPAGRIGVPPAPRETRIYLGLWAIAAVFGVLFPLTGITILAMIVLDQCVIRTVPPLRRFFS